MDGVIVGIDQLHYAILTQDDVTAIVYQAPVAVGGLINVKVAPKSNSATLYADNRASETATALGEITMDIETKYLPLSVQAALLGHTIVNGVVIRKSTDMAPYVAIGFRSLKSTGKYRYTWLYKGRFTVPDDQVKTQEDKPDFQHQIIAGTFVMLDYNSNWKADGDEDEPGFVGGATWFNGVYGAPVDVIAPTVTTVPADGAAAVADASTVVWTFSEAINRNAVTAANFFVIAANAGTNVAGALAISADNTTVTFAPTGNFAAATAFIAVATTNVTDIAGNKLVANSLTNFTTA